MKSWQTSCTLKSKSKAGMILLVLLALMIAAAILSVALGSVWVPPAEVLRALLSPEDRAADRIVLYARLPRTLGCLVVGAGLAVSGSIIQNVLDNPLAAPNIIGVNSGAGLMVALSCAMFPSAVAVTPVLAFTGALGGVLLVLFIARKTGASRITLVLAGVAVSSMFSACIDAVVTFVPEALNGYSDFRIGGLRNLTMDRVMPAFWIVLVGVLLALLLASELDVLMLGADTARSLGLRVEQIRIVLLAIAAALAGASVSVAGLLGFVGLIVPHMMRRLIGEDSRSLLLGSALGGAAVLTICDLLARVLFAPFVLPVGIVLALLGGPFFIWLLLKQRGGRLT